MYAQTTATLLALQDTGELAATARCASQEADSVIKLLVKTYTYNLK